MLWEKLLELDPQSGSQHEDFCILDAPYLSFNFRDRVLGDVPPLRAASGCQHLLIEALLHPQALDLGPYHILRVLLHLPISEVDNSSMPGLISSDIGRCLFSIYDVLSAPSPHPRLPGFHDENYLSHVGG